MLTTRRKLRLNQDNHEELSKILTQPTRGKTHDSALWQLANRWVGILHGRLRRHAPYDQTHGWPSQDSTQTSAV